MPKRSSYLPSPDNSYRRNQRDLEFLYDYWNRSLAPNRSYDIRLPELLRANHLMRHLSSSPSNHGLRVNVSFTIFDDNDFLEPEDAYTQIGNASPYFVGSRNNGSHRTSSCNSNEIRCNNLVRDYARRMNENYVAAIERELIRARVLALIERDRIARNQNGLCNQRAQTTGHWNRFPVGNPTSFATVRSHEKQVNSREQNNPTCALFRYGCCATGKISSDVKQDCFTSQRPGFNDSPKAVNQHHCPGSLKTTLSGVSTFRNLQSNDNTLQNHRTAAPDRNDAIKRSPQQSMETCQGVSKTIVGTNKISHSVESHVKSDGAEINSDKRSLPPQPSSCQRNILEFGSSVATDGNRFAERQGYGVKRKLDDLRDRAAAAAFDSDQNADPKVIGKIKPRFRNAPMIFSSNEGAARTAKSRIRKSMEERSSLRRHAYFPKSANFLKMFRKEEMDERLRNNSSSGKNADENSQNREETERNPDAAHDDRAIRHDPRVERRTPTPRSTVHTTYNPIMRSSVSDPILDTSGFAIQLLRLAVLLYAPALTPALNLLIAQQNHQFAPMPSFEGSNDTLMQIFRSLNDQTAPNLPLISIGSERVPSTPLTAETNAASSVRAEEKQEDEPIVAEESPNPERASAATRINGSRKSNGRVRQNGRSRKLRLSSMLHSAVRLDRNIYTAEDPWKSEKSPRAEKRSENVRSLSTRGKNEVVAKEYFQNWLHRLLQHLNARGATNSGSSNEKEETRKGSARTIGESSPREESPRDTDCFDKKSPDSSKDNDSFTEYDEEHSDDQKSFTSTTSTSSSRSAKHDYGEERRIETSKD